MGTHRLTRQLASITIAVALVAAACGDDNNDSESPPDDAATTVAPGDSETPSTTVTTEAPPPAENGLGVTDSTIKIGIVTFDWDKLAAVGVSFGRANATDLYLAAIDGVNERGGINGRTLEAVSRVFLPVGAVEADRVCIELTEDEEVFAVIGTTLGDQVLCFTEQHQTAVVVANGMTESRLARAAAPYVTIVDSVENRTAEFLRIMEETGVLDGATVGIMGAVDVSIDNYETMLAAFRDVGFDPIEGLIGGNAGDLEASAREQDVIAERMHSAGVNVTVSTSGVPLAIFNAIDAGYETDQWLLGTLMTGRGLTDAGVPHDYLDGALAVSNTPLGSALQPTMGDDPLVAECIDDLRARTGNPLPYELEPPINDIGEALFVCSMIIVLEAGLTNAGDIVNNDTFQAGLEAIGEIDLPGYLDTSIGPDKYGAAEGLRLSRFDAATGIWNPVD